MRKTWKVLAGAMVWSLACNAALAADVLSYGEVPAWVVPQAVPQKLSGEAGGALRILLQDVQLNLAPKISEAFSDTILLIQSPQGLAAAGNLSLSWRPETDVITVHKLKILRTDQDVDVLGAGQSFTILRREGGLEYAALSGILTAAIQIEGLRVGDRVEFAYTLKRTDSLLGGVPEQVLSNPTAVPLGRAHMRVRWPADATIKWQASKHLEGVKESRAGGFVEVAVGQDNVEPVLQPADAPARFAILRLLQVTGFKSWPEVSSLLRPLFDSAAKFPQTSPLQAEVQRIRAASPDARIRVEMALRLVQDQIRYVYLGLNDARLVPAEADATWTRRYGDCKAKTALLIALLRELGVEAEPVAVSSRVGDMLPTALPMIGMFDHVLVRATVGGKTYWLDGTRQGDRKLDDLPVPGFRWGLPLRAAGAELLKIDVPPLQTPASRTEIVVDASAGSDKPATFTAKVVLRSDPATGTNLALSELTSTQREAALRKYWSGKSYWSDNWSEVTFRTVNVTFDDANGVLTLTTEGQGLMDWQGNSHLVSPLSIGSYEEFKREPGPNSDAPWLTAYPDYDVVTEQIKLPQKGAGYGSQGANVDKTIAGVQYRRTTKIVDGVFSTESSVRSMVSEFPAAEAPEAAKALRALWDDGVYVDLPSKVAKAKSLGTGSCTAVAGTPAPGAPTIRLARVSPAMGSVVNASTTLEMEVEYSIPDYREGEYSVSPQFSMGNYSSRGIDYKDGSSAIAACGPRGKLKIAVPLVSLWNDPKVTKPFEITVGLMKRLGDAQARSSTVPASTAMFSLEAPGAPVAAAQDRDPLLAPVIDRATAMKVLQQNLSTSEGRIMLRSFWRQTLMAQFPDVGAELGLASGKAGEFYDLIARQQIDLSASGRGLMLEDALDPAARRDWQRKMVEQERANQAELAATLGESRSKWYEYQSSLAVRQQLGRLKAALETGANALTNEQIASLLTRLTAEQSRLDQGMREWSASVAAGISSDMFKEYEQDVKSGHGRLKNVAATVLDGSQREAYSLLLDSDEDWEKSLTALFGKLGTAAVRDRQVVVPK